VFFLVVFIPRISFGAIINLNAFAVGQTESRVCPVENTNKKTQQFGSATALQFTISFANPAFDGTDEVRRQKRTKTNPNCGAVQLKSTGCGKKNIAQNRHSIIQLLRSCVFPCCFYTPNFIRGYCRFNCCRSCFFSISVN